MDFKTPDKIDPNNIITRTKMNTPDHLKEKKLKTLKNQGGKCLQ